MRCTHRHLVIHRNDVEDHVIEQGAAETSCSCRPGVVCPVCDWEDMDGACMVYAPADLVESRSVRPPGTPLN